MLNSSILSIDETLTMKEYTALPTALGLEPRQQMQFSVISSKIVWKSLICLQRCRWCILHSQETGLKLLGMVRWLSQKLATVRKDYGIVQKYRLKIVAAKGLQAAWNLIKAVYIALISTFVCYFWFCFVLFCFAYMRSYINDEKQLSWQEQRAQK